MSEKVIILSAHDEMLSRLERITRSNHAAERLFPLILESAGEETTGAGLVQTLVLAFSEYTEDLPLVMKQTMWASVPAYVNALIDDETARIEALQAFAEAQEILRNL